MRKPTKAAAKPAATAELTDAQKLARVRRAKANLKKAEAAIAKAQAIKSTIQKELDAALAAL